MRKIRLINYSMFFAAHQSIQEVNAGDDLTLDLFSLDRLTITFSGSEGADVHVCGVVGSTATCEPKYNGKVSVENASLVLSGLSSSDSGKFTVKDDTGNVLSVCSVIVKGMSNLIISFVV